MHQCTKNFGQRSSDSSTNHFAKNYPNAKELKWEKGKDNYETAFEVGETEVEIGLDAFPASVRTMLQRTIQDQKPKKLQRSVTKAKHAFCRNLRRTSITAPAHRVATAAAGMKALQLPVQAGKGH